ncbi:hypothetical protein HDU88_004769 [Geranomyces variabilis]|nr:hypothetical protein HDU88_004769 [Geranomyces variabilis]
MGVTFTNLGGTLVAGKPVTVSWTLSTTTANTITFTGGVKGSVSPTDFMFFYLDTTDGALGVANILTSAPLYSAPLNQLTGTFVVPVPSPLLLNSVYCFNVIVNLESHSTQSFALQADPSATAAQTPATPTLRNVPTVASSPSPSSGIAPVPAAQAPLDGQVHSTSSDSPPVGAIVGGVAAGIIVLVALAYLTYRMRLRRQARAATKVSHSELPTSHASSPPAAPTAPTPASAMHHAAIPEPVPTVAAVPTAQPIPAAGTLDAAAVSNIDNDADYAAGTLDAAAASNIDNDADYYAEDYYAEDVEAKHQAPSQSIGEAVGGAQDLESAAASSTPLRRSLSSEASSIRLSENDHAEPPPAYDFAANHAAAASSAVSSSAEGVMVNTSSSMTPELMVACCSYAPAAPEETACVVGDSLWVMSRRADGTAYVLNGTSNRSGLVPDFVLAKPK